ncbi:MAG TPA: hypothetical protein ENN12_05420 [Epsilonproteobacteria bacterium]|nr:hypothetical protein [Campylobacterota bacterium]
MLKEFSNIGMGTFALLKEKIEEELNKLEEKGKIKTEDAKSFLKSLEEKGAKEEDVLKDKIKSSFREIMDELGLATKEDIQKLKEELQSKD